MPLPPNIPIQSMKDFGARLPTAGGQDIEFVMQDQRFGRDLMSMLKPGDVLHGRVVEQFANGSYLFTIRGRNMIATSNSPLTRDSVVAFEVLQTKEGLQIRLLNPGQQADLSKTSNFQTRLQQLQLPNNPQSQLVLQHFEQQGAPLQSNRLQQALQAVQQAPTPQQSLVAQSHAVLAQHQLPATPALLQLAQTAITQHNASSAQVLPQLQQQLTQMPQLLPTQITNNPAIQSATTNPTATAAQSPEQLQTQQQLPMQTQGLSSNNNATQNNVTQQQSIVLQMAQLNMQQSADVETALRMNGIVSQTENTNPERVNPVTNNNTAQLLPQEQVDIPLKTLVQELAQISQNMQQNESLQQDNNGLKQVLREMNADTILKPQHLNDYDAVLPLVLQDQGAAQQARIAIAHRPVPGQQQAATFLRVDMELQKLGPLSLRMSSGHGPIVITIFATGQAITRLEQALPALQEDLQDIHIEAHIRIGDLLEHQEAQYG